MTSSVNIKLSKEICQALSHFKSIRKSSEESQAKIKFIHEGILDEQEQTAARRNNSSNDGKNSSTDHSDQHHLQSHDYVKLKKLYKEAIKWCAEEEDVLLIILARLQEIIDQKKPKTESEPKRRKTQHQTQTPTTTTTTTTAAAAASVPVASTPAPAATEATPQTVPTGPAPTPVRKSTSTSKAYLNEEQLFMEGDKCAARVSGAAEGEESFWILASIVKACDKGRYEVVDEDPGDDNDPNPIRKTYKLPRSKIIPLPKDFATHKPFSKGSRVLAMFPETTTFYPAVVELAPKTTHNYSLKFDNDDEDGKTPIRKVNFKFVAPLPKN